MNTDIKSIGSVEIIKDFSDGRQEIEIVRNNQLKNGRQALASCLANEVGDNFDFYISRMLFGDGGVSGGSLKSVDVNRNGLFGQTRVNKSVISSINPDNTSQAIFTTIINKSEANGFTLNEIALQMNTGDLYAMATFGGFTKTEEMQVTFNWRVTFI
jgi:hypothetical protein